MNVTDKTKWNLIITVNNNYYSAWSIFSKSIKRANESVFYKEPRPTASSGQGWGPYLKETAS
jgi:hypothetical protein